MLIGDGFTYSDIAELLAPAEAQLQRTIHSAIYSLSEFKSKRDTEDSFLVRVTKQSKIMIIGSIDDL